MTRPPEPVLVTGAAGFVGARLCARLVAEGRSVTGLVRSRPSADSLFGRLGLTETVPLVSTVEPGWDKAIAELAPRAVVNLAGCSQVGVAQADPGAAFRANTAFVWELLDALRRAERLPHFIHASTEAVYGAGAGGRFCERDPVAPLAPYAASKAAAETVIRSYGAAFGISAVIFRFGNIYGAEDPNHARLIPDLTRAFAAGRAPRLREGRSVRTYLHVEDAVEAILNVAERADEDGVRGAIFNVAGSEPYSNIEVARLAREASGRTDIEIVVGESATSTIQFASTEKIRQALDWQPRIALADGLKRIAHEEAAR